MHSFPPEIDQSVKLHIDFSNIQWKFSTSLDPDFSIFTSFIFQCPNLCFSITQTWVSLDFICIPFTFCTNIELITAQYRATELKFRIASRNAGKGGIWKLGEMSLASLISNLVGPPIDLQSKCFVRIDHIHISTSYQWWRGVISYQRRLTAQHPFPGTSHHLKTLEGTPQHLKAPHSTCGHSIALEDIPGIWKHSRALELLLNHFNCWHSKHTQGTF